MSIAIDCGANLGSVTKQLVEKYDTVWAFEPNKYAFRGLCLRCSQFKNLYMINAALVPSWFEGTFVRVYFPKNRKQTSGTSIYSGKSNVSEDKYDDIIAIRFSQFIKGILWKHKFIDYIKMDVEGAEYELITDLINQNLINNIGWMDVEFHAKKHYLFIDAEERLKNLIKEKNITNIGNHY